LKRADLVRVLFGGDPRPLSRHRMTGDSSTLFCLPLILFEKMTGSGLPFAGVFFLFFQIADGLRSCRGRG